MNRILVQHQLRGRIAIDKKWKLLRSVSNSPLINLLFIPRKFECSNVTSLLPFPFSSRILFTLKVFLARRTVCDTIGIRRSSIKTVERFITRCKTNGIVTVYTGAVIDMGRNMENCFRKTY